MDQIEARFIWAGSEANPQRLGSVSHLGKGSAGEKRSPLVEHSMKAAGGDCFRLCATQPGTVVA